MPGPAAPPLAATTAQVAAWTRRDWDPATAAEIAAEAEARSGGPADLIPDLADDLGDGADAWEAGEAGQWAAAAAGEELPAALRGCFPAGRCPRDGGDGAGFAAGGVADRLAPGAVLAGLTGDAWAAGLGRASDDELIGVLRAWHRLGSWVAAGELAAVTELSARRDAEVAAGADPHLAEHVGDELAVSLTLTGRAADRMLGFAYGLARLPLTAAALAHGVIDRGRAWVIADELSDLSPALAQAAEARLLRRAGHQTSGQLRAAARRAVLAADPAAAKRRCEKARKQARVEAWDEGTGGTAALAGRDLPPADVLAADKRIDTLARHARAAGAVGTLDQLRARVYVALLLARPVDNSTTAQPETARGDSTGHDHPARATPSQDHAADDAPGADGETPATGAARGGAAHDPRRGLAAGPPGYGVGVSSVPGVASGVTASVNLTMPLSTWLGSTSAPAEVPGFGPIPASDARALADLATAAPGSRWCLTFTDQTGRAVAHGCAHTRKPSPGQPRTRGGATRTTATGATDSSSPIHDWELTVTIRPLAVTDCTHVRETPGYRPSPSLTHIIQTRHRTCSFPGCRRRATACDCDHTLAHARGGRTCECNLAALCRRHHRAKQAQGWKLEQPHPGILLWRTPHGRTYRTQPDPYPEE
jgi:Domain of unknown function (DUF222)